MNCHGFVGVFGWCWVSGPGEILRILLDVCWDRIVGDGKVRNWGWLLGRR